MDTEKLKKNRAALRATTTKFVNKVYQMLAGEPDLNNLEIALDQLIEKTNNLKAANNKILAVIESKDIEAEVEKVGNEYDYNLRA